MGRLIYSRVLGAAQMALGIVALISSYTNVITFAPFANGEPLWTSYRLIQLGGIVGGIAVMFGSRWGRYLSTAFWAVQTIALAGIDWRLDFATAYKFDISISTAPGTVYDMNPPTSVFSLNLFAIGALVLIWGRELLVACQRIGELEERAV